jgi:uncharacterized protein YecE (DUF72 family)
LFGMAPEALRFGLKVPEMITVRTWPVQERYGPRAGQENETFLDAALFIEAFLEPLAPYRERIAVLIFEFGSFSRAQYPDIEPFLKDLAVFLDRLPEGFRYAVEVRNADFLEPAYFEMLRARNVGHVFNAWTRMPEIGTLLTRPEAFTADCVVVRALLRAGRSYEDAVKMFSPYDRVRDPNEAVRAVLRRLIQQSLQTKKPTYIFVNNRLEGNAPGTIEAVIAGEEDETSE